MESKKKHRLLRQIKDPSFNVDNIHQYDLHILLGPQDFKIIVSEAQTSKCLLLEDYALLGAKNYTSLVKIISSIYDNHSFIKAGFWRKVKVGIKNNKFSLVPLALFDESNLFDYLKLNCKVNRRADQLLYYEHKSSSIISCFVINKEIYNWFQAIYPRIKIKYIHQSSTLIEGSLSQAPNYPENTAFLFFDKSKLHVILTKNRNIEYYNQFIISQFQDNVKYTMLTLKGLKRSQKQTNIIVWGTIEKKSIQERELRKKIEKMTFGERPKNYKYGFVFDDLQAHQYFDIFNVHRCN